MEWKTDMDKIADNGDNQLQYITIVLIVQSLNVGKCTWLIPSLSTGKDTTTGHYSIIYIG